MTLEDFVRADPKDSQNFSSGHMISRWDLGDELREDFPDFLARLWMLFGPAEVQYEGFSYIIKHVPSGKVFSAYSAGSGPAYGGDKELLPLVTEFNKLLREVPLADCKIKFETDEGWFEAGSKNDRLFLNPLGGSEDEN